MALRKMLKAAALLITVGYCSLLLYQGGVTFNFQETRPGSVSDLSIEPVNEGNAFQKITLDDVFISVKTTKHYQSTRLPVILKTWFQLAKEQTWFFTDTENPQLQRQTNYHMINTNCSASHQRKHLCCKTSVEYDHFLESGKKWFCHFDDDNYVNVPRLVTVLQGYQPQLDWYLGRPSVNKPLRVFNKPLPILKKPAEKMFSFWFATGGAGFCISRSLALKMLPVASGGRFISICEGIRLPDDVTMGYIIEHLLKNNLTLIPEFHSHLEQMKLLPVDKFREQISFSYSGLNVVNVPGFDTRYDPTRIKQRKRIEANDRLKDFRKIVNRFLSLHCFLFPHFKFCPR